MLQTEKNIVFLGITGGVAMLIGAVILFRQNHSLRGFQFYTDWSGTGESWVSEGTLSWQGLAFLGLLCLAMAAPFLFKKKTWRN